MRNKVFVVESGVEFSPFSTEKLRCDSSLGESDELIPIPEPFGNQIVYFSHQGSKQVIQCDNGRRGLSFAHPQLTRHLASLH